MSHIDKRWCPLSVWGYRVMGAYTYGPQYRLPYISPLYEGMYMGACTSISHLYGGCRVMAMTNMANMLVLVRNKAQIDFSLQGFYKRWSPPALGGRPHRRVSMALFCTASRRIPASAITNQGAETGDLVPL